MNDAMAAVIGPPLPRTIIDLSPTISEDLPLRTWGERALKDFGFHRTTEFQLIQRNEPLYISNAYWTLMNHAGPHVDAPNHLQRDAPGVDSYQLTTLVGPICLVDARGVPIDQPISVEELSVHNIRPGDVLVVLTGYSTPGPDEVPGFRVLSKEAAEYLARIPIRAFASDALSADSFRELYRKMADGISFAYSDFVHHSFLSRGIPIIEQLTNLDSLIGVHNAVFVSLPLKVKDADASPVRAVAFVY